MIVTQTTPPDYLPLTLAEVKLHLRIDGTTEDAMLPALLGAAVDTCQQLTGRSLMSQAWRLTLDGFDDVMPLPWPTVQTIESVQYKDANSATQTLDVSVYLRNGDKVFRASGKTWPAVLDEPGAVWVDYTAGYSTGTEAQQQAAVPYGIKAWLLLKVGTLYANRESIQTGVSVSALPDRFVDTLLDRFKVY